MEDSRLRHDGRGVWLRICDDRGSEQSSVIVIGDYTFYAHSFEDGKPLLLDYEQHAGDGASETRDVLKLGQRLARPDGDKLFAGGGTHLLVSA